MWYTQVVFMTIFNVIYCDSKPNVILIIADDLGWDDVSFHGSDQILTPNIDLLAYSGVMLNQYRTHPICTPSRAALLTGKFAHKIGMQGYPLTNGEDRGLPVEEKILPQYLKELNYSTHLVGKWHLGHSREAYLPQNRGFDTHFGHRGGFIDYYEYVAEETWTTGKVSGLDLFRNSIAAWDVEGYITDIYTTEAKKIINNHDSSRPLFLQVAHGAAHSGNVGATLQAPPEVVRQMRHIESPERRILAAMVKKLDDSVGEIVNALREKDMLLNTIIIFISDNGGMTIEPDPNYASNWPLRGVKNSPWEGGIKVVGTVWSPDMIDANHIWNGKMHSVDWLPTILKAVGAKVPTNIDGLDLWDNILDNKESDRQEVIEIDDYAGYLAIIKGKYKLVSGDIDNVYSYYNGSELQGIIGETPSYENAIINSLAYKSFHEIGRDVDMEILKLRNELVISCKVHDDNICFPSKEKPCLYNIDEDPCETTDLSDDPANTGLINELTDRLKDEWSNRIPRRMPLYRDPRARPSLFNYTWATWHDFTDSDTDSSHILYYSY